MCLAECSGPPHIPLGAGIAYLFAVQLGPWLSTRLRKQATHELVVTQVEAMLILRPAPDVAPELLLAVPASVGNEDERRLRPHHHLVHPDLGVP